MKINYMREFVMAVDNLNITSTASQLFLTQPALSRHFAIIEESIGTQLLVRSGKTFSLTPIGQKAFIEFKRILEQYDALVSHAALYSSGTVGELKIGMMYYSIKEHITPTVELFKTAYPGVKLHFFSFQPYQIISALLNNQIDKVFIEFKRILEQYDALISHAALYSSGIVGELKIGMLYYSIKEHITPTVELFKAAYPNVKLHFFSFQHHQIISALLNNQIDIGPVIKYNFPDSEQLIFSNTINRMRHVVMLPASHPLSGRKSVGLNELTKEKLILLKSDPELTMYDKARFAECGFVPEETVYTDQIDTVAFTIRETGGVHVTSHDMKNMKLEDIAFVDIEDENLYGEVCFAAKIGNSNPAIPLFMKQAEKLKIDV